METEINVTAILKDKPQGVKLYSSICGAVELKEVLDVRKKKSIVVKELNSSNQHRFWYDGKFFRAGQCVLQPSKEMADWSKFSWKKGDVLVSRGGTVEVIFDGFDDDDYVNFKGKHALKTIEGESEYNGDSDDGYDFYTENYHLESEDAAQTYINTIEEKLGGKLNRETLEIEKTQPEFKDGDILACISSRGCIYIFIFRCLSANLVSYYANKDAYNNLFFSNGFIQSNEYIIRYATEEEKQQLFKALAKEGKAWDAEKKMFVDLKKKVELKPFDKVLVRDNEDDIWEVSLFGYKDELYYRCDNGIPWIQCIPYDGNKHLLGTTNNVEG